MSARLERIFGDLPKNPPDVRTPTQRDRDRILYTAEFRRLAAVTQVVGSHETELFHNRLTHTLKVAQIGRRIAERLQGEGHDVDPDAVEAAALAHDIGHPPFGHIAEEKLDELMRAGPVPVPDGFEGNAQSFRVITRLATHSGDHSGLNLTRVSLQGLTKYPWLRAAEGKRHRKYGSYDDDRAVFDWSREGLAADRVDQQTPEAAIMDWADDVAYAIHDLEDFYRAGFVPLDRLARDAPSQDGFLERTLERWREQDKEYTEAEWDSCEQIARTVLFKEFPTEMPSPSLLTRYSTLKTNQFVSGIGIEDGVVVLDSGYQDQLNLLKSLTWTYVIESPSLAAQQEGQRRIVTVLFHYFCDVAASNPTLLPPWASAILASGSGSHAELKRVACDVVANLSESQAHALHARVTGSHSGSIYEAISR